MSVDFLGALGAGSDIDTKSLVQSLVDAERAPKEQLINRKISESEATVSAYGIVAASLETLQAAFEKLNDARDFADYAVTVSGEETSSGSAAFTVEATADISPGINTVEIDSLATADRYVTSPGFDEPDTILNDDTNFSISVSINGAAAESIIVVDKTPQGVVEAINESDLGVTAALVDTGAASERYRITVTGDVGLDNNFTITTNANDGTKLEFPSQISTASNAELVVNGVPVVRSSNTVDDVIAGATLNLMGETVSEASISVSQSTTAIKDRLAELVEAYNAVHKQFDKMSDPESTEDLGGVLSADSIFSQVERTVQKFFTDASSTPGSVITRFSDIGIGLTRSGTLEIDDDQLTSALSDNFSEVVLMLTANTDNQSSFGEADRGLAGDALITLADLLDSSGPVKNRVSNIENRVDDYEDDLAELDRRMKQIYDRYLAQFTAMETAIDQMNNTRDYLTSALEGLPFTNKNK